MFRHFADEALKPTWFGTDEGWTSLGHGMDFRVGGVEHDEGRWANGTTSRSESRCVVYYDGHEDPALREQRTGGILDNLGQALATA